MESRPSHPSSVTPNPGVRITDARETRPQPHRQHRLIRFIEEEDPHPKSGQPRCKVTFLDGKTLLVDGGFDLIERLAGQIVQAPPGYSVIEVDSPDTFAGEPTFTTFPVVAFRAMADACLLPLLPAGEPSSPYGWALIYPDGRCDALWDRLYDSVEEFKADHVKRRAEQMEQGR